MTSPDLNHTELERYLGRVSGRWALDGAWLGGARVADSRGAGPQRERGPEYVIVLVSAAFDGVPWLERVHQAGSLWDASEMGAPTDVHCYTPPELERKVVSLRPVREAVRYGIDLVQDAHAR
ncbi:MAG: hypothetical protein H0T43_10755 [Solirubrobacterales bacterium]|nr:hypothetical protein [Solirubrobacterales bacterium]